jgi:hypothetical protein
MVLPLALEIAVQITLPDQNNQILRQSFMHVWFLWSAWDLGTHLLR